jgi:hypothetical protein
MSLSDWLDKWYHRSPAENVRDWRMTRRTGSADFPYDYETVRRSPYHMDARRPVDRLFRYQHVLRRRGAWKELEFSGQTVLELGCGPLLGWGPIGVYLDICVEPRLREEVFRSDHIARHFFLPLHYQLEALFGRGVSFTEFTTRLRERIEIAVEPFERTRVSDASVDLAISNGVLQHIVPIDDAVRQLRRIAAPTARQFHVINFTDHESPQDNPFAKIYRQSPKEYFRTQSLLNLKRPSEMLALFSRHGLGVDLVPYFVERELQGGTIDPYWTRFDARDLAIQIAFFVS